jgi:N6-adenosine-specific RNA methylase IME4
VRAREKALRARKVLLNGSPYLELFARQGRHGWDSWGNETDKNGIMRDEDEDLAAEQLQAELEGISR